MPKQPRIPDFFCQFNYERKMIADVIRLGSKFPNLWMSFEVDITALKENIDSKKEFKYSNQDFPSLFIRATSRILDQHPEF